MQVILTFQVICLEKTLQFNLTFFWVYYYVLFEFLNFWGIDYLRTNHIFNIFNIYCSDHLVANLIYIYIP